MSSLGLTKERRRMVVVLLLGSVLVVLNQTLLSPALPYIMNAMNVDATTVQWLTSVYSMTEAVVIPLAAWFMGRFRTRTLFIGGMGIFAIGSLVLTIAPVFPVLILGRVLQACATGVMMVMVMSLILLSFSRENRGQAMGLVSLVIAFAPVIGPTVGGFLVEAVGWRALFLIVMVLAVLVMILASRSLVNYDGFPNTSADALSAIFSTIGLVSLLYGLSSFSSSSNPALCVALMVIGIIFVALFARRQMSLEQPMLRLEVLKSRRYRNAVITMALLQAVLIGLTVLMPLYIQNVLGYSALVSGLAILPGALIGAFLGLLGGRIYDRSGIRGIALVSSLILVVGGIGMVLYRADSGLGAVIFINILTSAGSQLLFTPLNTWGVNSLDNRLVQHATSVTNTTNQVGASLGTALIMSFSAFGESFAAPDASAIERTFTGYHLSFIVALIIIVVVFFAVLVFVRNKSTDTVLQISEGAEEAPAPAVQTVGDVMDTDPLSLPSTATIGQATQAFAKSNYSGAVILDEQNKVCGFISNSDILKLFGDRMEVVAGGGSGFSVLHMADDSNVQDRAASVSQINVMDIATKQVVSVSPKMNLEEACLQLAEKRLKVLPVIDDGKLVGVLRRHSLMQRLAGLFNAENAKLTASGSTTVPA